MGRGGVVCDGVCVLVVVLWLPTVLVCVMMTYVSLLLVLFGIVDAGVCSGMLSVV